MEEIERLNYELMKYKSNQCGQKLSAINFTETSSSMMESTSRTTSSCTIVGMHSIKSSDDNELIATINKLKQENCLLLADNKNLRMKSKALHETLENMKVRNCDLEYTNQRLVEHTAKNISYDSYPENKQLKDYLMEIEDLRYLIHPKCFLSHFLDP